MPLASDQEIVEKALAGDMQAFRRLVERHQRFVYALAYRMVGTVGDAEDITQETFIRLWKNLSRYRCEIKLTTWLYKITTNLCLDFLKSAYNKHTKRTLDLDDHRGMFSAWPADQPLLSEELAVALEKISAELSPKQKAVFVLRDMEDLPMPEIGQILSLSSGKVKSNLYYARKKVGELIAKHYETTKPVKP
jgi:RNA polymerase sigma-70 factor, ECF subfamily